MRDLTHLLPPSPVDIEDEWGSYEHVLRVAGVDVRAFKTFGDYQGSWWAKVRFPNGEVAYVRGEYGSCSGCDAFEDEFGYRDEDHTLDRYRTFALTYLEQCYTLEEALKEIEPHRTYDIEADEIMKWLRQVNELS